MAAEADKRQSCTKIFAILIAILFLCAALALAGYVLYVKFGEKCKESTEEDILEKYGALFRSPEEQALFDDKFYNTNTFRRYVNYSTFDVWSSQCFNSCIRANPSISNPRKKRLAADCHATDPNMEIKCPQRIYYQACCQVQPYSISPLEVIPYNSTQRVQVVQFGKKRQFFNTEECTATSDCRFCKCTQEYRLVTVLTKTFSDSKWTPSLSLAALPLCCKCHNES